MPLSRRAVLGGAVAAAGVTVTGGLVEHDVLPGRTRAHALLGLNGASGVVPDVVPGPLREGTLRSDRVADDPRWWVSLPPDQVGGDPLPVVVCLHGAGYGAVQWREHLGLDRFLAASGHDFALAGVDGGLDSVWFPRDDGDAGAMLRDDFLPVLERLGLDTARLGLLGWSMGGLGALYLAPGLDGAVVLAVSPALWPDREQARPGVFVSDEHYAEVMGRVAGALSLDVRVDCGTGDPFYRDVRSVLEEASPSPEPAQEYAAGAHAAAYWTRVLPGQLDWLASRLL